MSLWLWVISVRCPQPWEITPCVLFYLLGFCHGNAVLMPSPQVEGCVSKPLPQVWNCVSGPGFKRGQRPWAGRGQENLLFLVVSWMYFLLSLFLRGGMTSGIQSHL